MTWSYDNTALGTSTESERINSVRFLLGDTDSTDEQVQNEEIVFALSQNNNDIYFTASWLAYSLSSKYSRYVDVELDGQLSEKYSQLSSQYNNLSKVLSSQGKTLGNNLYMYAGGIREAQVETIQEDTSRLKPEFSDGQFKNPDYDNTYNIRED